MITCTAQDATTTICISDNATSTIQMATNSDYVVILLVVIAALALLDLVRRVLSADIFGIKKTR